MRVRYERSREPQLPFQETEFTHLRPGGDFGDQPCANRAMRPRRPTILGLTPANVEAHPAGGNRVVFHGLAGGAEGIRTPDLCSAIAALSHLSYSPEPRAHYVRKRRVSTRERV